MKTQTAANIFTSLASEIRLDLFRLLVKNHPQGLVASDIAARLQIPRNALSFHLKSLLSVSLVSVAKEGRFLRYRANIPLMLDTISFLTGECCTGNNVSCDDADNE